MVYHFQNSCYLYFLDFCNVLLKQIITIPNDLSIVTCCNHEDKSILISQLNKNNIKYINIVPHGITWNNVLKIGYIVESLKVVDTEHTLILDANDVLLDSSIVNIVNCFEEFNKDIIFNATANNYPKINIDIVNDRDNRGKFKYFNAGCCIGYTEKLKLFYDEAFNIKDMYNPWNSE